MTTDGQHAMTISGEELIAEAHWHERDIIVPLGTLAVGASIDVPALGATIRRTA